VVCVGVYPGARRKTRQYIMYNVWGVAKDTPRRVIKVEKWRVAGRVTAITDIGLAAMLIIVVCMFAQERCLVHEGVGTACRITLR